MALVNCEVTLDLDWPENCVICEADRTAAFSISSTKLYVTVVTLSTHAIAKLLQQWKSGFKRSIIGVNFNQIQISIQLEINI